MKKLRKVGILFLSVLMMLSATLPVFAADARLSHGVSANYSFVIDSAGLSEVYVSYTGNSTSFTQITVETYIQKRSLGFIWTKVDNGETDKTWVDTGTKVNSYFVHDLQLDAKGTYRAVFKITFSGTGAEDDVIEDKIQAVYE